MNRRNFIRLSGAGLAGLIACTGDPRRADTSGVKAPDFPIHVRSDRATGHLVRAGQQWPEGPVVDTETLIVGGGVAGLAAASSLPTGDFLLCELSDRLGGTSAALDYAGRHYAQGAHYDLAYPENFGPEALQLLESLDIINFNVHSRHWEFRDKQFLIPEDRESRCWVSGRYDADVLPAGALKKDFLDLMLPYAGSMPLPTRLIPERYHSLNAISFREYLDRYLYLSPEFLMRVDYQMLDDYGGTTSQVSALAGIHYYQCRPYEATTGVELFSPPEGNHYFIRKLASRLPADQLLTGHLVTQLIPTGQGVEAQVLDVQAQTRKRVRARQVVYAGQKHALNYVYPQDATRFSGNEYAPWFVINLVLDRPLTDEAYWQNEVIRPETRMLGFVNSHAQQRAPEDPQVLTIYYCYPPEYRHYLTNLEAESRQLIQSSLRELAQFFGYPIDAQVREAFVSLMGHAMPIPKPGYLLQDPNAQRADQRVAYAGVDTGRLPLFFEALDSGIMAARALG